MDRTAFFANLRQSPMFDGRLTQDQVNGIEAILDASTGLPVEYVAYCLATAYHETGGHMAPNRESLNYSVDGLLNTFSRTRISETDARRYGRIDKVVNGKKTVVRAADQRAIANTVYGGEWGRKHLGNIHPNDGWDYRGGGQAHTTGRTNYEKVRDATGVDVVSHPDKILDPKVAAVALVKASVEGWYTGRCLGDYLPGDYVGARRVINGTDKATVIAGYAMEFERALRQAGWGTVEAPIQTPEPEPVPEPAPEVPLPPTPTPVLPKAPIWLVALNSIMKSIFGGRA